MTSCLHSFVTNVRTYRFYFTAVALAGFIFNNTVEDNRYYTLRSCKVMQLDSLQRKAGSLQGWVLNGAIGFWERQMLCCIEYRSNTSSPAFAISPP